MTQHAGIRPWFALAALSCPLLAALCFTVGVVGSPRLGSGDAWGWGAAFLLVGLMGLALAIGSVLAVVSLMRSERPVWLAWLAFAVNCVPLIVGLSMTRL